MSLTSTRRPAWAAASTPPRLGTLVLLAGSSVMAMNIFLPVLPEIGAALQAPPHVAQYILTLFLAATAINQLFIGPLADQFGRRPVLLVTTVLFVIATLICIFATSIEMLLFGRIMQAAIAASMALSRAIIRDLYDRSKAASMIGYVTMAMAVLPMVTPMIGGFVGEAFGWRSTFVILLLVGLGVVALVYFDVGETHTPAPVSMAQQVTATASLLREREIWGYLLCAAFASGVFFAFLGGAPFIGKQVIGMTPSQLGLYFAFLAVGYMFGNFIAGRYSEQVGLERMMLLGCLICTLGAAISFGLMTGLGPAAAYLFGPMLLVGLGNGMTLPNANAGAVSVRPDLAGSASGLGGFLQIGGGAALASLSGSLISAGNQGLPLYIIMVSTSLIGGVIALAMYLKAERQGAGRDD